MSLAADCLKDRRVLDVSQYIPGPYAGRILGDLGATVVKVEPPGGDPFRRMGQVSSDRISAAYESINRGKMIVELDLKSERGTETFEALVGAADILIESFRPGVMDRLGFPSLRLKSLNASLIHCAISGWGQSGPYSEKPGHDINYMALGGSLLYCGSSERPAVTWPPVADFASSQHAALMILAALVSRDQSGRGSYIDVSIMETVLAWQEPWIAEGMHAGQHPRSRASHILNGGAAAYNIYVTADARFISLGIVTESRFWRNFCEAVGQPRWIDRFSDPLPQLDLIDEVSALFKGQPLEYWNVILGDVETCYEPLWTYDEMADHPQIRAREIVKYRDGSSSIASISIPVWRDGRPPPARGRMTLASVQEVIHAWS